MDEAERREALDFIAGMLEENLAAILQAEGELLALKARITGSGD